MPGSERLTTTVSTKGRIVLPKAVRAPRRWGAGTRLVVENTPDGVLLKSAHGGACAASWERLCLARTFVHGRFTPLCGRDTSVPRTPCDEVCLAKNPTAHMP